MAETLHAIIERVRRATRNPDIVTICDELSRRLVAPEVVEAMAKRDAQEKLTRAQIQKNYRARKKARLGGGA